MKKILVPTDLSELSFSVKDALRSILDDRDVEVHLLYCLESTTSRQTPYIDGHSETALRDREEEALAHLTEIGRELIPGIRQFVPVVLRGDPVGGIIGYAEEHHCDLIIMATHGRTGLAHMLVGSVAEKVVRYSSVPVLSVKPKEMRTHLVAPADVEEQLHFH
ncbi:MAG TPA: universal stress protein [Bacteroidota bacterium]|nr:universal stress protein [Bacteroidota bacterium]